MTHTDSRDDILRKEAVDLATDLVSFLLSQRATVQPGDAYRVSMECVRMADRIQKARRADEPVEVRRFFHEARTAAQRALVSLERACAVYRIPRKDTETLYHRLHLMALATGALGTLASPED